ncbi:MAG: RHS repeat-associated core domain-containing protein, partial [Microthrixaceae bacterium]
HQRPLEHAPGLQPVIEMGARQYHPVLARFLEVDPIEGGVLNDYGYVVDPINQTDLSGEWVYDYDYILNIDPYNPGRIDRRFNNLGVAKRLISLIVAKPSNYFPFQISGRIRTGATVCTRPKTALGVGDSCSNVRVGFVGALSFDFVALPGHVQPAGSTIRFAIRPTSTGALVLNVKARGKGNAPKGNALIDKYFAPDMWGGMALALNGAMYGLRPK